MSKLKRRLLFLTLLGFVATTFGQVQAYVDNRKYELERARNALLDRRDQLARAYQRLLQDNDDLNRQLTRVQQRLKYVSDDLKHTDQSLTDVEFSLKR